MSFINHFPEFGDTQTAKLAAPTYQDKFAYFFDISVTACLLTGSRFAEAALGFSDSRDLE